MSPSTFDPQIAPGGSAERSSILLLDGVCNFCNATAAFVIERDPDAHFRFAALQSEAGRRVLRAHGLPEDDLQTAILIRDGRIYKRSDAILQVARQLPGPWSWLYTFRVIPRALRDFAYDRFARSRYALFGKRADCIVPAPDVRLRFL